MVARGDYGMRADLSPWEEGIDMVTMLSRIRSRAARCLVLALALASLMPAAAIAVPANGWGTMANGERCWYDDGVMARSKEVYDPATGDWYWFDADGSMAHDKDVYLPAGNKWVRYDSQGHMIKGEDHRYDGWYWFDPTTGAMTKGFVCIPADGGGSKWVFYDYISGQMAHGERFIDGAFGDQVGWMYFDDYTGEVVYGWKDLPGKRVFYDRITGRMVHGWQNIDGQSYYFDEYTGALSTPPSSSDESHIATVYVTRSGSKYHRSTCPTLSRSNPIAMSLGDALAEGYSACKVCKP